MTAVEQLPVTVLICTRNRPDMVVDSVSSMLRGSVLPSEIVVIDQSDEALSDLASAGDCPVIHVRQPGRGLSRARNLGVASASYEHIAIIDDDMLVEPDWLGHLFDAIQSPRDVVTGRVLRYEGEPDRFPVPDAALITRNEPAEWSGETDRDVVPGAGLILPKALVVEVGGYDERLGAGSAFGAAEDNDLGLRLLRAGCTVRHEPAAVSWHRGRTHRGAVLATSWSYGVGKGAFYSKHIASSVVRRRLVRDTVVRLARSVVRLPRDPSGSAADATYAVGVIVGSLRWWVGRHHRRPMRTH